MMKIFQIDNGKVPNAPFNFMEYQWISSLPAETSCGNLVLKGMKLITRLDEANRRLDESYRYWTKAKSQDVQILAVERPFERHVFASEQAIYLMRTAADEVIAMLWYLNEYESIGTFSDGIEIDSIGPLLKMLEKKDRIWKLRGLLEKHAEMLNVLNKVSNALKHSFVQSDITFMGADEPIVFALASGRNSIKAGTSLHRVRLSKLIDDFSHFYRESIGWIEEYGIRHRATPVKIREFKQVDKIIDY